MINLQQSQEFENCKNDIFYFIDKYVKIYSPYYASEDVNIILKDYQKETLQQFQNNKFNIILKDRQIGMSTLIAIYSQWRMLFFKCEKIMYISPSHNMNMFFLNKLNTIFNSVPNDFNKITEDMSFIIRGISSEDSMFRKDATLYIVDEAFYCFNFKKIFSFIEENNKSFIISSSMKNKEKMILNEDQKLFCELYENAYYKKNNYNCIKLLNVIK